MTLWKLRSVPQASMFGLFQGLDFAHCPLTELMIDGFKDMFGTFLVPGCSGQCKYECAKNWHLKYVCLSPAFFITHT